MLDSGPGSPPLGVVAPVEEVEEEEGKREERAGELVDLDGHHAVGHVAGGVRAGVEVVAGAQAHVRHAAAVVDLERRDEKKAGRLKKTVRQRTLSLVWAFKA